MSLKNIIAEIDTDVLDVTRTSFEHRKNYLILMLCPRSEYEKAI